MIVSSIILGVLIVPEYGKLSFHCSVYHTRVRTWMSDPVIEQHIACQALAISHVIKGVFKVC